MPTFFHLKLKYVLSRGEAYLLVVPSGYFIPERTPEGKSRVECFNDDMQKLNDMSEMLLTPKSIQISVANFGVLIIPILQREKNI